MMRRSATASALIIAAGLAACGSSSISSQTTIVRTVTEAKTTTTSAALAHAQFVAKLDAICKSGDAAGAELQKEFEQTDSSDYTKLAALWQRWLQIKKPNQARVDDLIPPPSDAGAFARYQRADNRISGVVVRIVAALKAKDITEASRLHALGEQAQKQRTNAALDLGTQFCGS